MIHNKPSRECQDIGYQISSFYLQKNNGDCAAARKEVESLLITGIEVNGEAVRISTSRPGLLIGKRGENLDNLAKHLKRHINITESFHWNSILVPVEYDPLDDCGDGSYDFDSGDLLKTR